MEWIKDPAKIIRESGGKIGEPEILAINHFLTEAKTLVDRLEKSQILPEEGRIAVLGCMALTSLNLMAYKDPRSLLHVIAKLEETIGILHAQGKL